MDDLELAMKLAELQARAARMCGLSRYPRELIRLGEAIDRQAMGGRAVPPGISKPSLILEPTPLNPLRGAP